MGYIYKLTNLINNKVYIGQTSTSLKLRMNKHYSRANKDGHITGVDAAIKKYGKDNFKVEVLCQCDNQQLDYYESYYIKQYDSYNTDKGYNLTAGGTYSWSYLGLNESEVISKYFELKSISRVAKYYACSERTISDILHKNEIVLFKPKGNIDNLKLNWGKGSTHKPVKIVELDLKFKSIKECADWFINSGYSSVKIPKYVSKGLCKVLKGKCKTYHGFKIQYVDSK